MLNEWPPHWQTAGMWGVHTYDQSWKGNISQLLRDGPPLTTTRDTPLTRETTNPVPTLLQGIPPPMPMPEWTPTDVLKWLSPGAPGLDGWTHDQIKALPDESLLQLCRLLDRAN